MNTNKHESLSLVEMNGGARASARFTIRKYKTMKASRQPAFYQLKRRERRAPLPTTVQEAVRVASCPFVVL
jgi:hypothetical protein